MTDDYEGYDEMSAERADENYEEEMEEYDDGLPIYSDSEQCAEQQTSQYSDMYPQHQSVYDDGYNSLSKSQEETRYLLEPDDIPEHLKDIFWAISSRHLELINIPTQSDLKDYNRAVNRIIRAVGWSRASKDLNVGDIEQIKFFAQKILLPKSLGRGERTLIATTISRQENDYSDRQVGTVGTKPGVLSTLKESLGGLFGG